jgi:hypothetical protein
MPISWWRQKACGWVLSVVIPRGQGTAPPFIGKGGGSLQAYRTVLATCDGMADSATEWTAVLANLASGGASWHALCPSRSGFESGGVEISRWVVVRTLTRGCSWREAVGHTAASVEASCRSITPQRRDGAAAPGMASGWRGWSRRTDGDGGDTSHWPDVMAWSWAGVEQMSVPLLRVPSSSFESAARRPYETGRHSVTELTPVLPHSVVKWRGWPYRESWRNSVEIWFLGVSETWRGFVFDPGACKCQSIKSSCRGSRYRAGEPVKSSSEVEPHPRVRPALERGGTSPEGVTDPRARRNLTRGGDQPSSEAEVR